MNLIIVESPTKARTISQFVGENYRVESSHGHIRDLPKSQLGIDIENNFEPKYVIPRKAQKRVTELRKAARKAARVILATDEDREGEAIAWHLTEALGLNAQSKTKNESPKETESSRDLKSESADNQDSRHLQGATDSHRIERIVFNEITKLAIEEALKHPRQLDLNLVNAQQARRILDRLVGYKLSPFLWKKVVRGLSAGRVQSVALRLIADREEEIKKFKAEEYWTITALLQQSEGGKTKREKFEATLYKIGDEAISKLDIKTKEDAEKIVKDLEKGFYRVTQVTRKEIKKHPLAPFTTSTLQQEATKKLGFTAKKTMFIAQGLYERGMITYMRTDSLNISEEALLAAHRWIEKNLPPPYRLDAPRTFKTKSKLAQEAHEAIRPTNPEADIKTLKLQKDDARLYDLIWRRFIASQLPSANFDVVNVDIDANLEDKKYQLKANGMTLRFDGFLKLWPMKFEGKNLPELKEGEPLELLDLKPEQHFTEPPPRYNEASLIKTLEKYGIGRPSTYAPIISVIQERNYVEKRQGRFYTTEIGALVNGLLKEHFPEIVDIDFTAKMEEELDLIALGKAKWQDVIGEFYAPFSKHLAEKYESVEKREPSEVTDEKCDKCGKPMVVKFGRFGKFLACSGFPECKNAKTLKEAPQGTGIQCPKCLETPNRNENPGELVVRRVRNGRARGKIFWGCSRYPDCDYATWTDPARTENQKPEPTNEVERAFHNEAQRARKEMNPLPSPNGTKLPRKTKHQQKRIS